VVLIPARIGYGETGGPDLENAGRCDAKNFAPGVDAAANEIAAVLERARVLPYVNLSRGLVIGTSYGGLTSIRLKQKPARFGRRSKLLRGFRRGSNQPAGKSLLR
jgi:hypothetical protein